MSEYSFKIFIVDDDPSARMVVTFQLSDPAYHILEFDSGEECLEHMDENPDLILLDIEMPGRNGIEICRALRDQGHDRAQVLFLSGHDDLEIRLRAYDAGGNDFVSKSAEPEELLRKVQSAERFLRNRRGVEEQAHYAQTAAFTAMTSMGEMGTVLNFLRSTFACQNAAQLAITLFEALEQYELLGLVGFFTDTRMDSFSSVGECSPLECSILAYARKMDRLVQSKNRLIINYPMVCLVILKLPEDPERVGRLRDHLAMMIEGLAARVAAMENDRLRTLQANAIVEATASLTKSINLIESSRSRLGKQVLSVSSDYVAELEGSFMYLGLSEDQERSLILKANQAMDRITDLINADQALSDRLADVVAQLRELR